MVPEQVSAEGRVLALAITDLLNDKHTNFDTTMMAMTCVIASMLVEIDEDEDAKIKWFVDNLKMLMQSYQLFRDKVIMQ